eukprot:1543436-Alexandrium_andersonii.AAC.1
MRREHDVQVDARALALRDLSIACQQGHPLQERVLSRHSITARVYCRAAHSMRPIAHMEGGRASIP